jgi:opacity protein-like surface antigen
MSTRLIQGSLVLGLCLLASSVATAQEREPHSGSMAAGFDIGAFVPKDGTFESSLVLNALYEYYLTPRVSLRTEFGWADPSFKREGSDSLRQLPLRLDVNYNWEGGKWHPFVGAGVGAYFLQTRDNGQSFGDSETNAGFNFGGGAEYFLTRNFSLKGEGRYHVIDDTRSGLDPSGFAITGGVKKYF